MRFVAPPVSGILAPALMLDSCGDVRDDACERRRKPGPAIGQFAPSQNARVVAVPRSLIPMVGFGSDASCRRAIWRSVDGASWSCIGNDPAFSGSAVSDAAAAPEVEVLVGSGLDGAVVWTSIPN